PLGIEEVRRLLGDWLRAALDPAGAATALAPLGTALGADAAQPVARALAAEVDRQTPTLLGPALRALGPVRQRIRRAIHLLAPTGTPAARGAVARFAAGPRGSVVTEAAREALARPAAPPGGAAPLNPPPPAAPAP